MAEENKGFHPVKAFKDKIDKNKKFLKGLTMGLVAGIIVTAAIAVAIALRPAPEPAAEPIEEDDPDAVVMLSQIAEISELATVEQTYSICDKVTNTDRIFDLIDNPFTENWFILAYSATLKAGVNLENAQINIDGTIVRITLPEPEIISNEIHTDSFHVLHESNNVFSPIHVDDVTSYIDQSRTNAEAASLEDGLLDKAKISAEEIVSALLMAGLPEGYTVEFTSPSADTAAEAE